MKKDFVSKQHPLMNPFLQHLQTVLESLINNPKPECEGFYLAYFNPRKNLLIAEKIGFVPLEKEYKYLCIACKKATQTIYLKKIRSKEFENDKLEQYQGGFVIYTLDGPFSAGVSGHDSAIDEAISILWLIAKKIIRESDATYAFVASRKFYTLIKHEATNIQSEYAPDNKWINIIAEMMENNASIS